MPDEPRLSRKSERILRKIAGGHTYEQILHTYAGITYVDIFHAAAEALEALGLPSESRPGLERIRREFPRAYEKWTEEEDGRLVQMYRSGVSPAEIARQLQRREFGIMARLVKVGLLSEDDVPALKELQERRHRPSGQGAA
jgi:uncharacterized protein (DUF433 family)